MSSKEATFTWKLEAFEEQGNLCLKWSTTAPFRAQKGTIAVYDREFPLNPEDGRKAWSWDDAHDRRWNTGLTWGSNWYCSYNAQKSPDGPETYIVKLPHTKADKQ